MKKAEWTLFLFWHENKDKKLKIKLKLKYKKRQREQAKGEACTIVNPLEWSSWIFAFVKEKGVGRKTEKKNKISTQLREGKGKSTECYPHGVCHLSCFCKKSVHLIIVSLIQLTTNKAKGCIISIEKLMLCIALLWISCKSVFSPCSSVCSLACHYSLALQ